MAEVGDAPKLVAEKVRVVRCPRCGKLLSEMGAFGSYRCGNCNATLQAKRPPLFPDANKSASQDNGTHEETILSNMSRETNKENRIFHHAEERKLLVDTVVVCNGSPASGISSNERGNVLTETNMEKHGSPVYENFSRKIAFEDQNSSCNLAFQGSCSDLDAAYKSKDMQVKNIGRMGGLHGAFSHGGETRECRPGFQRTQKGSSPGSRFSPYRVEGPPAIHNNSIHAHREYHNPDLPDTVERLEKSREELLKKLDELRDQLSKSCELKEPMKEKVPIVNNRKQTDYDGFYEGASSTNWPSFHHFPSIEGHDVDVQNSYHTNCDRNGLFVHGGPMGSYPEVCREDQYHVPRERHHVFGHGHHDMYVVNSHDHDAFYCQPTCSCSHCFKNHWHMISQHPKSNSIDRRPYSTNFPSFYPAGYNACIGGRNCFSRMASSSFLPSQPDIHRRYALKAKSEQRCRPVAGAAPFIVCDNCFDLLLLSHDLLLNKNQKELRCGSCFHVMSLEMNGKQLRVASLGSEGGPNNSTAEGIADDEHPVDEKHMPGDSTVECNHETTDNKHLCSSYTLNHSEEIQDGNYSSGLAELENKMQASSPGGSNDESVDTVLHLRDLPSSSEMLLKCEQNSHIPNLLLHEHLRCPSSCGTSSNDTECDQAVTTTELAITSNCVESQNEFALSDKVKHKSVLDATRQLEFNLQNNEHPHYCEDLLERRREECCLREDQGSEQVATGLIKNSLKETHWSTQPLEKSKHKVSINGHPLPDRLVKKAEKQAGRIYPGDYWYDYRAGFWGVMGRPCTGIIPPFIEEFNYPMPSECAGGNTNILVNGRELHQKDLELLAGRGLPSSGGRSFVIEISGRVWDAVSGEELDSLGKLAPTIEKLRRGFGMRIISID